MENIHGFALYFGEKKMCKDFVNKYDKKSKLSDTIYRAFYKRIYKKVL